MALLHVDTITLLPLHHMTAKVALFSSPDLPNSGSAALVRDRCIMFADATAGRMPEGKAGVPRGVAQSADVEAWWRAVSEAIAPIDRWLP